MDLQLAGRRALVTGRSGCSAGWSGRPTGLTVLPSVAAATAGGATAAPRKPRHRTAAALLAEGARVAIAARDPDRLAGAAASLGAQAGREVHAVEVDTGDDASVRRLAATAEELLGGIDILINCAAKPAGQAPPLSLPEVTTEAFWSDVNVKVLGYLRCAQAVAPGMAVRAARAQAAGTAAAEIERRMARLSLTRTLIDASEVAAVITFLASLLSVAINGEAIGCGGGTPGVIRY